jgi:hypothetical protein
MFVDGIGHTSGLSPTRYFAATVIADRDNGTEQRRMGTRLVAVIHQLKLYLNQKE